MLATIKSNGKVHSTHLASLCKDVHLAHWGYLGGVISTHCPKERFWVVPLISPHPSSSHIYPRKAHSRCLWDRAQSLPCAPPRAASSVAPASQTRCVALSVDFLLFCPEPAPSGYFMVSAHCSVQCVLIDHPREAWPPLSEEPATPAASDRPGEETEDSAF